jgi:hypothetical protein
MNAAADTAANLLAVVHIAYFLFIVGGVVAIVATAVGVSGLTWVRNPWFRIAHVGSIYIVLVEEITGWPCPLNVLQWSARTAAIDRRETDVGVGGVLDFLLYHAIPGWTLDVMYWSFGALVLVLLWKVPPRFRQSRA